MKTMVSRFFSLTSVLFMALFFTACWNPEVPGPGVPGPGPGPGPTCVTNSGVSLQNLGTQYEYWDNHVGAYIPVYGVSAFDDCTGALVIVLFDEGSAPGFGYTEVITAIITDSCNPILYWDGAYFYLGHEEIPEHCCLSGCGRMTNPDELPESDVQKRMESNQSFQDAHQNWLDNVRPKLIEQLNSAAE